MHRAARAAEEREKTATKIRGARYDSARDAVVVDLSTGATLIVPRRLIAGFSNAPSHALSDIQINPGGESLWSDALDDGVLLEQLLEIAAGAEFLKVLGGRISGRKRSTAKMAASRANGAKGGRPPLTMTAFIEYLDRALHHLVPNAPTADRTHNPNPSFPASAYWRSGGRVLLYAKIHGANEIQVESAWPRKRVIERRIRATADRLAREFLRWASGHAVSDTGVTITEARALARRAQSRKAGPTKRREASG
jgi:hypothetical protein